MVALQVNRSGRFFMAIEGAAGDTGDLLMVDDGLAILDDGDMATQQGDIEDLPFARSSGLLRNGSQKTINRSHVMARRLSKRIVLDLHLVTSAKIDAAVGIAG